VCKVDVMLCHVHLPLNVETDLDTSVMVWYMKKSTPRIVSHPGMFLGQVEAPTICAASHAMASVSVQVHPRQSGIMMGWRIHSCHNN
jgi:REP element-mobilizing transposase RayT